MRLLLIILFLIDSKNSILGLPLPFNQYAYMLARNNLTAKKLDLNDKERFVNIYMEKLKFEEFGQTADYFFPSRPIETELTNVTSSNIYKFLKKLPKGGNLHIHEFQMLNRRKFLEIVFNREPEFSWLHICVKENNPDCLPNPSECKCTNYFLSYFAKKAAKGWIPVKGSNWTIEKIIEKTTLTGILNGLDEKIYPTDSRGRWLAANKYGVFGFYSDLTKYNRTRFDYLKACLDLSLEENVQLVEFRRSNFGGLYYIDDNLDKVYIEPEEELEMLIEFKNNYIKQNSKLIDFVFVIYGSRSRSKSDINSTLEASLKIQSKFPQMIRGFDLVGEEDQGHTLLFHSDTLIRGFNYSQSSNGTFNLIFHTAETNWPEDMEPAQFGDAVSTLNNIYDSIILRTSRVGHGIGLIKHPELYQYLIEREIAIEACPASNQILGYVSDLRNHPAINFFRSGIPIVLAGDDPGSFGYNDLTVDYYLAYMAWGLDLFDLKVIANNSIKYSSIPHEIKQIGYKKFEIEWQKFIDETYKDVCLKRDKNSQVNVSNLLPSFGPSNKQVELNIYGIGFERAICQKIFCLFNDVKTEAKMVGIGEIKCLTPLLQINKTQNIEIKISIGEYNYSTYFMYTFIKDAIPIISDKTTINYEHNFNNSKFTSSPFIFTFIYLFLTLFL